MQLLRFWGSRGFWVLGVSWFRGLSSGFWGLRFRVWASQFWGLGFRVFGLRGEGSCGFEGLGGGGGGAYCRLPQGLLVLWSFLKEFYEAAQRGIRLWGLRLQGFGVRGLGLRGKSFGVRGLKIIGSHGLAAFRCGATGQGSCSEHIQTTFILL